MSECVMKMEMPSGCHDCKLRNMVGNCPIPMFDGQDEKKIWTLAECFQRPPWCPIICQLPEGHGRLVDERELFARCRPVKNFDNPDAPVIVKGAIIQSQTIVPADIERSVYERKQKKYTNWIGEEMVEQQIDKDVSRFADGEWWKEMQE